LGTGIWDISNRLPVKGRAYGPNMVVIMCFLTEVKQKVPCQIYLLSCLFLAWQVSFSVPPFFSHERKRIIVPAYRVYQWRSHTRLNVIGGLLFRIAPGTHRYSILKIVYV
jgi:hypothetical protein